MSYFHSNKCTGKTVSSIRSKVGNALKLEGFEVLTEIDIQAATKKKLGEDYLPLLILGVCNPGFAAKVLSVDQHISLMLACNMTSRELENQQIEVAIINPLEATKAIDIHIIEDSSEWSMNNYILYRIKLARITKEKIYLKKN
jgi:uncharacterized protein (DUF302 family)